MKNISTHSQITSVDQSDGLWHLAWRRLKHNRAALCSLLIVLTYFILLVLSLTGVIVKDWNKEVAISYAPPSFLQATTQYSQQYHPVQSTDLAITTPKQDYGIRDPLAADMLAIQTELKQDPHAQVTLAQTLAFGADRWGQDIIAKTINIRILLKSHNKLPLSY